LGELRQSDHGDALEAEGSGAESIPGPHGARGDEGSEQPRDEEDAHLVGPHVVRHRRRHRLRHIRPHRPRGQDRGRTRRRHILRRFRCLRLVLRLLLHRVRRRNPRRRFHLLHSLFCFTFARFQTRTRLNLHTKITTFNLGFYIEKTLIIKVGFWNFFYLFKKPINLNRYKYFFFNNYIFICLY